MMMMIMQKENDRNTVQTYIVDRCPSFESTENWKEKMNDRVEKGEREREQASEHYHNL